MKYQTIHKRKKRRGRKSSVPLYIISIFPLQYVLLTYCLYLLYTLFFYRIFSRHENEKRPSDYLRQEYVDRLAKGVVNYRLQIQIHEASPSDTATIFHAGILWDKETHPWLDLATVTIRTPISPDVLER